MRRSKESYPSGSPMENGWRRNRVTLEQLPEPPSIHPTDEGNLLERQQAFGYTLEDLRVIMEPMASTGGEPVGSMGNDAPLAVLSDKPQLVYSYFKQLFAQVTNPPLDAIREELVTSTESFIGCQQNLFEETPQTLPSATAERADRHERRVGEDPPDRCRRHRIRYAADAVPRRQRRRIVRGSPGGPLPPGFQGRSGWTRHHHTVGPGAWTVSTRPSPACWPPRQSITT